MSTTVYLMGASSFSSNRLIAPLGRLGSSIQVGAMAFVEASIIKSAHCLRTTVRRPCHLQYCGTVLDKFTCVDVNSRSFCFVLTSIIVPLGTEPYIALSCIQQQRYLTLAWRILALIHCSFPSSSC